MTSYGAPTITRVERGTRSGGSGGPFLKFIALLLGIAVGVLSVSAVVMMKIADDARDDARAAASAPDAAAATTDHSSHSATSSNVSLPLESFAGKTAADAEALAKAHAATDARLPAVPAGDVVKVHMTLKDMVVEIAPGVKYNTWAFDGHGAPGPDRPRP